MKRHAAYKDILLWTFLFLVTGMAFPHGVKSEEAPTTRLALLPFEVHASRDLSYLREGVRDMLTARLAARAGIRMIDKARIDTLLKEDSAKNKSVAGLQKLGKKFAADYLISGSITGIGAALSIDIQLINIKNKNALPKNFSATVDHENLVIAAIDKLAGDIGGQLSPMKPAALPGATADGRVEIKKPAAASKRFGFERSQNFKIELQAMDVGDVDGDGSDEIVLAGKSNIEVYKQRDKKLHLFFKVPVVARYKVYEVNLADLNNNGRAEIYVSSVDVNEANSFGVEWQGENFRYLFKDARWHVRPLAVPGKGLVLAGQRSAPGMPFMNGIFVMKLADNAVTPAERLEVPDKVNLFDFAFGDLDNDGTVEIVAVDRYDRLKILQKNGKLLWKSDEHYGGATRYVGGQDRLSETGQGFRTDEATGEERVYVPTRIIIMDINGDKVSEVIVNRNPESSSRTLANVKSYPSGMIQALAWNGLGLTPVWESPKIDGHIADYQIREDESGKKAIYVGLVLNHDWLSFKSKTESTVVNYPLDMGH